MSYKPRFSHCLVDHRRSHETDPGTLTRTLLSKEGAYSIRSVALAFVEWTGSLYFRRYSDGLFVSSFRQPFVSKSGGCGAATTAPSPIFLLAVYTIDFDD